MEEGAGDMTAYIWDLDGTLLDSYEVIVTAAYQAVNEAGVPHSREEVLRAVKGGSLTVYFKDTEARSGVPQDRLMERYRQITHAMDDRIPLMDGAAEALESLRRKGAGHYVFTHRGSSAVPILKRLGILGYFREVANLETGLAAKPSGEGVRYLVDKYGLDPRATWYVGDRALDMLCGKDAGVRTLLLLPEDSPVKPTGFEDRVIRSLRELI